VHSLVGLDHDRPLTELLTWGDDRAAEQAERLRAEHPKLHASTGTPLHPMAPLPKLMWFRENEPELFERVRRWVGIKELIVHRLTGKWVINVSCASGTGLMSLDTLDWDPVALAIAGVERDQLSRVVPCEETVSLESGELGLARGTPLVIGGGDGPLPNLGLGSVVQAIADDDDDVSSVWRGAHGADGAGPSAGARWTFPRLLVCCSTDSWSKESLSAAL
jgi:gluconokinase